MGKLLVHVALIALTAGALLFSGCAAVRELPREVRNAESDSPEHERCRELLLCFLKNDSNGFLKRISPESAERFNADKFEATRKTITETLGEPVSFAYVTKLEFMTFTPHIWKIRFKKTGKKGVVRYNEALFRILTGRAQDGRVIVIGFNFL